MSKTKGFSVFFWMILSHEVSRLFPTCTHTSTYANFENLLHIHCTLADIPLLYPCIGLACRLVRLVYMVCWFKLKMLLNRSPNFTLCFFPSDCYDWMLQFSVLLLKYMCFTLFSTFNLILSATGKTGHDGRETYGFC